MPPCCQAFHFATVAFGSANNQAAVATPRLKLRASETTTTGKQQRSPFVGHTQPHIFNLVPHAKSLEIIPNGYLASVGSFPCGGNNYPSRDFLRSSLLMPIETRAPQSQSHQNKPNQPSRGSNQNKSQSLKALNTTQSKPNHP